MSKQSEQSDIRQLVIQACAGNQQALEVLIKHSLPSVFGLSLRYMKNSYDAEDATQETFVKVWKNLKKFDVQKNFKNWVLEIAKNTCLDILKKKKIIPFSAFDTSDGNVLAETLASTDPLPLQLTETQILKNAFQKMKTKLAPIYQKILALYYDEGLNFREISNELNEPINTVKSRHRRALLMLKKFLTQI